MKFKTVLRIMAFVLLFAMMTSVFAACTPEKPGPDKPNTPTKYNTEKDPIVFSTLELDGVFNPFYSTSGTDSSVWGMTQVAMFDTDAQGKAVWGGDRPCLALDYQSEVVYGNDDEEVTNSTYTDYTYVLKPGAKFSDGHNISIKDVLFFYYVNLDPVYTGNSTIYSSEILGLHEYRTQTSYNPDNQGSSSESSFNSQFVQQAEARADNLVQEVYNILTEHYKATIPTDTIAYNSTTGEYTLTSDVYNLLPEEFKQDYFDVAVTFYKELVTDFNSAESMSFEPSDKGVEPYPNITDPRQYFFYINGMLATDKEGDALPAYDEEGKTQNPNLLKALTLTESEIIQLVFSNKMPGQYQDKKESTSYYQILNYWVTGNTMKTEWAAEAKGESLTQAKEIDHIYGITWNKQFEGDQIDPVTGDNYLRPSCYDANTNSIVIGDKVYPLAQYNENDELISGYEVLNIRIKKVDPKAVWNFAGSVTPMHYYSSAEAIQAWDGYSNFGVYYADTDFYTSVVKAKTVPMGAGTYMATTANPGVTPLSYTSFYSDNVVYYERNPYFYTMFCDANGTVGSTENNAKIKYLRYQVVSAQQMLNMLTTKQIDFADPNATTANLAKVDQQSHLSYELIDNLGYGYIGINAGKDGLESVHVRRAIMCAMDTTLVKNYYSGGLAENIWYPMSKVSWAYPDDGTTAQTFRYAYNPANNYETIRDHLKLAAEGGGLYSWSGDKFFYNGKQLKLTFTIAGSTDDHPAYNTMQVAAEVLNSLGLKIEVKNDSNTLKKLSNGELQVWAAAWGSGIDPDMYQVYHIDSTATSVYNWGYREIRKNIGGKYDYELELIENLSVQIDAARETLVQEERAEIYANCLDMVMELAVELPTYQRKNLFVYNSDKIDKNTLVPSAECTPYQSPTAFLWKVNYVK